MADHTKIEWADATLNYINGCTLASPGCTNCYAMRLAGTRMKNHPTRAGLTNSTKAGPVWNGSLRAHQPHLLQALAWRKPRRIFWNAHGDLFHEDVPLDWIDAQFAVMAATPQHQHLILTKRSKRMRAYANKPETRQRIAALILRHAHAWGLSGEAMLALLANRAHEEDPEIVAWPLPNVWWGVSVEDQTRADIRVGDLLATPAALRFLSMEPLLGPVDIDCPEIDWAQYPAGNGFNPLWPEGDGRLLIDWVIVGGESGPNARPMHPEWARSLRDQCARARIPFFFKQWGEWAPIDGPKVKGCFSRDWPAGEKPKAEMQMLEVDGRRHDRNAVGAPSIYHAYCVAKVGKARAGRLLDGVEHNGFPEVRRA